MKRKISFILAFSLIFGLLQFWCTVPTYAEDSTTEAEATPTEEKVYSTLSPIAEYADDAVLVVLSHKASMKFEQFDS